MTARNLLIDAGQSGTRVCLIDDHQTTPRGQVTEQPGIRTDLPLARQLAQIVAAVVSETPAVGEVAIGSTGFTGNEELGDFDALAALGVRSILLAHDSTTSYLGALGAQEGAVVAAGTGVVTLAVGATQVARIDGWGNIMGDAGSGYWFGRAALDAAMRAYDGRGQHTMLLDRLRDEFGDVESAYIELQADPERVRRIASFSRWVTEALAAGDQVSSELLRHGARELAHSVMAGLDRVGITAAEKAPVCAIGGLFNSEALVENFFDVLRQHRPALWPATPLGDGLRGAAELLRLPLGSPLTARITRVTVAPG